jgi:hypothetical protein
MPASITESVTAHDRNNVDAVSARTIAPSPPSRAENNRQPLSYSPVGATFAIHAGHRSRRSTSMPTPTSGPSWASSPVSIPHTCSGPNAMSSPAASPATCSGVLVSRPM